MLEVRDIKTYKIQGNNTKVFFALIYANRPWIIKWNTYLALLSLQSNSNWEYQLIHFPPNLPPYILLLLYLYPLTNPSPFFIAYRFNSSANVSQDIKRFSSEMMTRAIYILLYYSNPNIINGNEDNKKLKVIYRL